MITRNSAECVYCLEEIESTHVHDFRVHYCNVKPAQAMTWEGDKIVPVPGQTTWNFAVDGGKCYLRRVGDHSSYTDTSTFDNDGEPA